MALLMPVMFLWMRAQLYGSAPLILSGAPVIGLPWAGVAEVATWMALSRGAGAQLRAERGFSPWVSSMWPLPVVWASSSVVAEI